MLKDGHSKKEILEKTGHTVGVNRVNFSVEEGEVLSLWASREAESPR